MGGAFRPGQRFLRRKPSARWTATLLTLPVFLLALPSPSGQDALAQCDVIPGVKNSFRGALGSLGRPFAIPGDDGEILTVRLNRSPGGCEEGDAGFSLTPGDQVVTIVFQPPAGPRNAVVLSTDCGARAAQLTACNTQLGGGSSTCVPVGGGGDPFGLEVPDADTLRFRFPDTDGLVTGIDRTLTGPAAIGVTAAASALPCDLGSVTTPRCADATGVLACIDEIYAKDGTCDTGAINIRPDFGHFTALPPANDYQALCQPAPNTPCTGLASELRFTVDAAGNALVPMDYRGVLVVSDRIPIPRLLLGDTSIEAFEGTGNPVQLPGSTFLASYSTGGHRLPPVFEPINNPDAVGELSLFGSVDAPVGVMRIQRRGCVGGSVPEGTSCTANVQCGGGTCQEVFDFSGRFAVDDPDDQNEVGPVVIPNIAAQLTLAAENPVPLDGLIQSEEMFAFVVSEAIEDVNLNDDTDATDPVIRIRDRRTGVILPIGFNSTDGRAVARVLQGRSRFPAVAVEGDIVAFLESEPLEGDCLVELDCDTNGDGDAFDSILRVYRLDPDCGGGVSCADELTTSLIVSQTVDAAPEVNGSSLAISFGRVYFRTRESSQALNKTTRVSVDSSGLQANGESIVNDKVSLSTDGRYVAFTSTATNLVVPDLGGFQDLFVHDMVSGKTTRLSNDESGVQADNESFQPALSADGRFVAFFSRATNLVPGGSTSNHVFVHDRDADDDGIFDDEGDGYDPGEISITQMSVDAAGVQGNSGSDRPSISTDGRFVAFASLATNLGPDPDTNVAFDVYVHDRDADDDGIFDDEGDGLDPGEITIEKASVSSAGAEGDDHSVYPSLSAIGRFAAFQTHATNLAPEDNNGLVADVLVRDRVTAETVQMSVDPAGTGGQLFSNQPSISADGRFVAFDSQANTFVPGDTNGVQDIFVRDRDVSEDGVFDEPGDVSMTRVSVSSAGLQAGGSMAGGLNASISGDGRFVAFLDGGSNLVPGDGNGVDDVFLHDRVTGHTVRVSVGPAGAEANAQSRLSLPGQGSISGDGRAIAFNSEATNLVLSDTNNFRDDFVRGPDPADLASDLTGDLDHDDTVLQVFDSAAPSAVPTALGAAEQVAVIAGSATFLLPESASGVDRNTDADTDDLFVHLSVAGAAAQDLNKEAVAIAMSSEIIAALVPSGPGGETFVEVYDWASPTPSWTPVGGAEVKSVGVAGSVVALLTTLDGEIQVFDFDDPGLTQLIPTPQKAEEFVLGENLVAFRTREASQGSDLNSDGDMADDVLQVHDLLSPQLFNTEQAVIPCPLEACDPRFPYRASGDTVTFITAECEQGGIEFDGCPGGGTDLNGDGDASDLIKQVFNVREAAALAAASSSASAAFASQVSAGECVTPVAGASVGICTDTGEACGTDLNCPSGTCYLPPGGCIADLATMCSQNSQCGAGEFCAPDGSGDKTCHKNQGPCANQADCTDPTNPGVCLNTATDFQRLFSPVAALGGGGAEALFTAGSCVEDIGPMCTSDGDCASDSRCGTGGSCERRHSACLTDADCDNGFTCAENLVIAGAADSDGDGLADPFDNCPRVANVDQADEDADGVGNLCFIPEPDLYILLATGIAFLATVGRRRMQP